MCRDVGVIRSADCWTDHKLLRAKISIKVPAKPSASKIRPRFAVSSLRDPKVRERYSNAVLREVTQDWRQEASWREEVEGHQGRIDQGCRDCSRAREETVA